jgi:hypothetical protein
VSQGPPGEARHLQEEAEAALIVAATREELETLAKAYRAAEDETHSERAQKMIDAEVRRVEAAFDELTKKIAISFVSHDPYANFAEMKARVSSERRLFVWTGGSDTPLWEPIHNWKARAVHDWDHLQHGLDFSMEGEAGTYRVSAARMPELAPLYLSEIALQAAVVNFSQVFEAQKLVRVAPKIERIVRELRGLRATQQGQGQGLNVLLVVWFVYGLYERGATDEEVMLHLRAADMSAGTALPIALAAKKLHEGRRRA